MPNPHVHVHVYTTCRNEAFLQLRVAVRVLRVAVRVLGVALILEDRADGLVLADL